MSNPVNAIDDVLSARLARAWIVLLAVALASCTPAPRAAPSVPTAAASGAASSYFPPPGDAWERRSAANVGLDSARIAEAVAFALANENVAWERDLQRAVEKFVAAEPYPEILGPTKPRGGPSGMIVRHGYIVAEWGDVHRVEMTFSVAKSYVATMAGLALDAGLIRDVHDPVRAYVNDGGFDGRNASITWHQLLNQTSEWEGTLWDKPDVADRREGRNRQLRDPGTFWEYNDVRVNRAALAILRVWRRPLPEVLKERIMDPIGASPTWEWHGYRNSFVDIDGRRVQSVSGGGHWGGGVWASTRDHARFGYLMLRRGRWEGRHLLSERWIDLATTPTAIKPIYGYMWWLNPEGGRYPAAPHSSYFALGAGGNVIWVDPEHDLLVVTRWLETSRINDFMALVTAALRES